MKKKLLNNIGMKLISVVAAFIIWVIIYNVDDAVITETITLQVQEINAEDLETYGKTYEVVSGGQATARIKGRSSVLRRYSSSDFVAVADLSNLSVTGAVFVDIRAKEYVRDVEIIPDNNVYKVVTENLTTKQFPITVKTNGNVATGYYLGEIKATPNLVSITGSETKISNIKEVVVELDVTGYSSNINTSNLKLLIYAHNGELMDTERLSIDAASVDVSIAMLRTKTVPINIEFVGDVANGYTVVSKEYAESTAVIAGNKNDLDDIDSIDVKCDISNLTDTLETTILYKDYLPEGIILAEGDIETTGIAAKVVVDKIVNKSIEFPLNEISLLGKQSDLLYSLNQGDTVTINVVGAESVLESMRISDLKVSANVAGMSTGIYKIPLVLYTEMDCDFEPNQSMNIKIFSDKE